MKIVFLDFDGVINNGPFFKDKPYIISLKDVKTGFESFFDPKNIESFNKIIGATNAKIVISSAWRNILDFPSLKQLLENIGITGEIIDKTPDLNTHERWTEIEQW